MEIQAEVIQKYLNRRLLDIQNCRQALVEKNWPVIQRVGHQMKGNGVTFGFPEIADIGIQLEAAVQTMDQKKICECIDQLERLVANSIITET